jgi:hypothetical protein
MRQILTSVMVLGVLAAPVLADDLNPPRWRGLPGTTLQEWEFNTADPDPMPNLYVSYGLQPSPAHVSPDSTWVPTWNGEQGVWMLLTGIIDVPIWNYPEPNPEKWIQVQLTWQPGDGVVGPPIPTVEEIQWGYSSNLVHQVSLPGNNIWTHSIYEIYMQPNPNHEVVQISGDIIVSELVIDTYCVPEPSTLVLLVMAGLGLLAYAWRRRRS